MSELDWSDPFMGKQLAISQADNSIDQDLTVPPFLPNRGSYDLAQQPQNIYQSLYSKFRRSETPNTYHQPSYLNVQNNNSFYIHKSSKMIDDNCERGQKQLAVIGQDEQFECRCSRKVKDNCAFCKGQGVIKGGNNLIKFFQYIIAFKLGKKQSYTKKKLNTFKKDTNINNFCNDFYNQNKETQSNYSFRSTIQPSKQTNRKKYIKSEIYTQIDNNSLTIHRNFVCDRCQISPIVGNRYHCNFCEDYDECENCYQNGTHHHELEKIDKCQRGRQLENMLKIDRHIKQNLSLRPPPCIKRPFQSFGTAVKSSIS